jgi:hypothetical protein
MTRARLTYVSLVAIMLFAMLAFGTVSNRARNQPAENAALDPAVQACDSLGTIWVEGEVVDYSSPTRWAWNGRWVRRGSSNVFDAIWIHRNGQKHVSSLTITIQGNRVYIARDNCRYSGTLASSGVQGTYRCPGAGVNNWSANIGCELGTGACGLGNEWRVNDTILPGVFNPGWVGVWTRQGTSNVFASKAYRAGEPEGHATIAVTIDGNKVFGQRTDEPNKYQVTDCVYEGFLIGQGSAATGTVTCNSGVGRLGPFFWDARILCGGGNQGGGGGGGGGGGAGPTCQGAAGYAVTVEPTAPRIGEPIVVRVTVPGGKPSPGAWVAIAKSGSPLNSYLDFSYLDQLSGFTREFRLPQEAGQYEVRVFLDSDYSNVAVRCPFAVEKATSSQSLSREPSRRPTGCQGSSLTLALSSDNLSSGQAVTARVTVPGGEPPSGSWIGVFPINSNNYIAWQYLVDLKQSNFSRSFALQTPGEYEIRTYLDSGYEKIASRCYLKVQ